MLVVDDHAVVRRGLLAFLDRAGPRRRRRRGRWRAGARAARATRRRGSAPGRRADGPADGPLDGIETTRRIRALYDDVEVVALTSFAEEERVHAALEAGAAGYVLKDADADEVAAAIRAVHRGELQLDPAVARACCRHSRAPHDEPPRLTARELDVLRLVGDGKANKEIAVELGLSERRSAPTYPTSSPSSASARAPRPLCGPPARGWWSSSPRATDVQDLSSIGRKTSLWVPQGWGMRRALVPFHEPLADARGSSIGSRRSVTSRR